MKYLFEVASRPALEEAVDLKHQSFINGLKNIESPWGIGEKSVNYPPPMFGGEILSIVEMKNLLGKSIKGQVIYRYRSQLNDDSSCDDHISINFNPSKIDYEFLIKDVFKKYITLFNGYSAAIFNEELIFEDFDKSRNMNLRNTILRFYPVSYFDETLCIKAIKLTPYEILARLNNEVEMVELFNGGILIIAGYSMLSKEDANIFDAKVSSLLGI